MQDNEDEAGIKRSQAYFHSLIASEIEAGIPSNRIVLGGFSQGGATSLMSGITCPQKLGGIFGLSCYLLLQGKIRDMVPRENPNKVSHRVVFSLRRVFPWFFWHLRLRQDTKIFMGHGDSDQVVQYKWGQKTAQKLQEWGWNVDFRTYKGLPHSAAAEEIDHLEQYLQQSIPDLGDKGSL